MADPFEEFVEKTGGEIPLDVTEEFKPQGAGPMSAPPASTGGGDVLGVLTSMLGIVFPVAGKIATKAIGSKI